MDLPDAALWELAAAGNGEAFGQLFDRHSRAVYLPGGSGRCRYPWP